MHCFSSGPRWPRRRWRWASTSRCPASPPSRKVAGPARHLRRGPARPASCWKPTAPTSPRRPIAASATNRPMSPTPPAPWRPVFGLTSRPIRRRDHRQFRPAVHQGRPRRKGRLMARLTLHHPRLRLLGRRAAPRRRLGRLRPREPEEPPPPLLAAGRTRETAERHHPRPDRHLARHARPAAGRRRRRAGRAWSTPIRHADHMHGIDDLRQIVFNMRRRLPVWADGPTQEALLVALRLCLRPARRLALSADPRPAHASTARSR